MKTQKMKITAVSILGSLLLGACGISGQTGAQGRGTAALEAAVQCTMESLKELDLETFNECTDNYVETYCNWLGIPVEREYRVFNELLQPGLKLGKRYRFNLEMAEKTVEHLEWEITDIREDGNRAEIDMEITNLELADVPGYYEILLLEDMIAAEGSGMWQMLSDMADLVNGGDMLLALMDEQEDTGTIAVTVSAFREGGSWKLHMSDEFINAFMGNMNLGEYSEEVKAQIAELEEAYEEKIAWEAGFYKR